MLREPSDYACLQGIESNKAGFLPFSLVTGHKASPAVLEAVRRQTGLASFDADAALDVSEHGEASDDTVVSYDTPQPKGPTVPSADSV